MQTPTVQSTNKRSKIVKSKFTPEEDKRLIELVNASHDIDWSYISSQIPNRNPRQCRERWQNYLNPKLKNKTWTEEEDRLIIERYHEMGPHWNAIGRTFDGRSGNAVRNRYLVLMRHMQKKQKHLFKDYDKVDFFDLKLGKLKPVLQQQAAQQHPPQPRPAPRPVQTPKQQPAQAQKIVMPQIYFKPLQQHYSALNSNIQLPSPPPTPTSPISNVSTPVFEPIKLPLPSVQEPFFGSEISSPEIIEVDFPILPVFEEPEVFDFIGNFFD